MAADLPNSARRRAAVMRLNPKLRMNHPPPDRPPGDLPGGRPGLPSERAAQMNGETFRTTPRPLE